MLPLNSYDITAFCDKYHKNQQKIVVTHRTVPCVTGEHRWGLSIGLCIGAQEDIHTTESLTTTRGVWNPIKSIINRVYE